MDDKTYAALWRIYEEYNIGEHEPDSVDTVDTVNYLLGLLGFEPKKNARNTETGT